MTPIRNLKLKRLMEDVGTVNDEILRLHAKIEKIQNQIKEIVSEVI